MIIQEMALGEIDLGDETFRISETIESERLLESLREFGQLNPVILLERESRRIVVCGWRRIRALQGLGVPRVFARILPEAFGFERACDLALSDNLAHRELDPLEKARALFNLKSTGTPDETLVRHYLPRLGLHPNAAVLQSHLLLHRIPNELRRCAADGRLTLASIERIAAMPPAAQMRLALLMGQIRLSASLQRKFLGLLEDLQRDPGDPPDAPLNRDDIAAIAGDSRLSPFQRGERVYEALYRLRYPKLSAALEQFAERRKQLGLPGSVRISAHPYFEEAGLHVEFDAPDAGRFRSLAGALAEAARSPELNALFDPF